MILFVAYAALIWTGAYFFRRRWPGYLIALASIVPVAAGSAFLLDLLPHGMRLVGPSVALIPAAYAFLVAAIALLIALQPRRSGVHCGNCFHDLTGNVIGVCPECGAEIDPHTRARLDALPLAHNQRSARPAD